MQRGLWKGGKKNEFIVAIGLDKEKKVEWSEIITWGEKKLLDVEVKDYLLDSDTAKLDLNKFSDFLYKDIEQKWVRKNFKDFDYISVSPPTWSVITSILVSLGACIAVFIWSIRNEFTMKHPFGKDYWDNSED